MGHDDVMRSLNGNNLSVHPSGDYPNQRNKKKMRKCDNNKTMIYSIQKTPFYKIVLSIIFSRGSSIQFEFSIKNSSPNLYPPQNSHSVSLDLNYGVYRC